MRYDSLVLVVGSRSNFFATLGAAEHAKTPDSTASAECFRVRLSRALNAMNAARQAGVARQLDIEIVDGGPTGVELAAELCEAREYIASYGMTALDSKRDVRIWLIEEAQRILTALPEHLSKMANDRLLKCGIEVMTNVRVASVGAGCPEDSGGKRYPADICVWAARIEAPSWLVKTGRSTNRLNRLVVDAFLRTDDRRIFALGDRALATRAAKSKPVPAGAQAAHQQASYLARELARRIRDRLGPMVPFEYRDRSALISVGGPRESAV
jgi:NADH dehydrogenase